MPFCQPSDMEAAIDTNWLYQLVLDNNQMATQAQFEASPRVLAAIASAAGRIIGVALQGGTYSLTDLQTLAGDSLALLVWLNVHIGAAHLAFSRQIPAEEVAKTIPAYGQAMDFLKQLGNGETIFNVPGAITAGKPALQRQCSPIVTSMVAYFGSLANPSPCCPVPDPCDPPGSSGCC